MWFKAKRRVVDHFTLSVNGPVKIQHLAGDFAADDFAVAGGMAICYQLLGF